MRARKLISILERALLGAAMSVVLFFAERRLSRMTRRDAKRD